MVRAFEVSQHALWIAILVSWAIAFFEYLFQVPANRIGSYEWTVPQLKVLQECITLIVFTLVAFVVFRSPVRWNYLVSYGLIVWSFVVDIVAALFNSNHWLRDTSPLSHITPAPAASPDASSSRELRRSSARW